MNSTILIFLLLAANYSCLKLPSSFKKCNRKQTDFNECLRKAVKDALGQLSKPFKQVGLPSLDPLEVPTMTIGAGSGAVALQQNYKNLKCYGLLSLGELSKFEMDFEKNTLIMESVFHQVIFEFEYETNGKILLLPIYGTGPGSIILDDLKFVLTFNLEEYNNKSKKHFKVVDSKFIMDPELITFKYDNLFDGDKALGDNINKVINDNWKAVFSDVKAGYEDAFAQIFAAIFNNLLVRVPVSELFGDE